MEHMFALGHAELSVDAVNGGQARVGVANVDGERLPAKDASDEAEVHDNLLSCWKEQPGVGEDVADIRRV